MTVYTISRPIAKTVKEKTDKRKYPLRSHMVTIFTTASASEKSVCDYFDGEFEKTQDYAEGWRLTGLHAISEFHQGHVKKWARYIDPVPPAMTAVIKDGPAHLRLVK
ncbi:MAG: hypothetical protein V4606_03780 [Patescibacteria group bacterium]